MLGRSKKFISYDSLRYENERMETFIQWPVDWVKPEDLARDGFYYLRTRDHCACVFCRGILGAWEVDDIPRDEHKRHFPHCPFVRGESVGNIPISQSHTLSKLSSNSCETQKHISPKTCVPNFLQLGCVQFREPQRADYLTYQSRIASYVNWPELVIQRPQELAEAGFFYCGLSDHVRCYHCGNGLRNWESEDRPWSEHAWWYPECTFVRVTKGYDFISMVYRERTLNTQRLPYNTPASTSAVASVRQIMESELDALMELDIIRNVVAMGFPTDIVRSSLHRKLEQTGLPFFSLEPCIEWTLQDMEEKTRQTLEHRAQYDDESENLLQASLTVENPSTYPTSIPSSNTLQVYTHVNFVSSSCVSTSETPLVSTVTMENVMGADEHVTGETSNITSEESAQSMTLITEEVLMSATSNFNSLCQKTDTLTVEDNHELYGGVTNLSSLKKNPVTFSKQSYEEMAEELEKTRNRKMCKVCMDADMEMLFFPCQHMVTCSQCAVAMTRCPVCRRAIEFYVKPIIT